MRIIVNLTSIIIHRLLSEVMYWVFVKTEVIGKVYPLLCIEGHFLLA